jgi:hypothetical protein
MQYARTLSASRRISPEGTVLSDLPGVEFPEVPAHPLLVHEEPNWKPALVVTAILDLVGLASLYYAYVLGAVQELAIGSSGPREWVVRALFGAVVTQLAAVPVAKRTRLPWIVAAWAAFFVVGAIFVAAFAFIAAGGVPIVIE